MDDTKPHIQKVQKTSKWTWKNQVYKTAEYLNYRIFKPQEIKDRKNPERNQRRKYTMANKHIKRGWTSLVIQFSSVTQLCPALCDPMDCSTPGFSVHHQLPELAQTNVHWVSDAIQPSHPLSSPPPPASIFPSMRVFSSESVLHIRWPKYWSFSFNISPSNEYSGLISFRIDWFDLLAVQGTLKSLLQHHSSKASILWNSAFFIVQLSHPYMTTGKTIALTRQTFVGKVTSLLFNMLSRLVYYSVQPPSVPSIPTCPAIKAFQPFLTFSLHKPRGWIHRMEPEQP